MHFLAKVNKSSYVSLQNMTPHDAYSIEINASTTTLLYISNKKRGKFTLSNKYNIDTNIKIIQSCQNLSVRFK